MVVTIVSANSIGVGIRGNITGINGLVVAAGVTVGSTDSTGISGTGTSNSVEVLGAVYGLDRGVRLGTAATGNLLIVHEGGSLWGGTFGADMLGGSSRTENAGSIGGGTGIKIEDEDPAGFSTLINSGSITGQLYGVEVSLNFGAAASVVNTGFMSGMEGALYIDCGNTCDVTVENYGTMANPLGRAGIAIDVDSPARRIDILNTGQIIGSVTLGTSKDLVDTSGGHIRGRVFLGGAADRYVGGAGADSVSGGAGKDALAGGAGADVFIYANPDHGGDRIGDWGGPDRFEIDVSGFGGGLVAGRLAGSQFRARADNHAQDGNDRFIFRTTDRTLWFDANGKAGGGLHLIADLQGGAVVTAGDILLV